MTEKKITLGQAIDLMFAGKYVSFVGEEKYKDLYMGYIGQVNTCFELNRKDTHTKEFNISSIHRFKDFVFEEYRLEPIKPVLHQWVRPVEVNNALSVYSASKWYESKEEFFSSNPGGRVLEWEEKQMPLKYKDWPER